MLIDYVCERCGGVAVTRDAWAEWDVALQLWVMRTLFDHAFCHDCRRATLLVERPAA
jgi:hypothetical protein